MQIDPKWPFWIGLKDLSALLLGGTIGLALIVLAGWTSLNWEPPSQFVHRYSGKLTVENRPLATLQSTCPSGRKCWGFAVIGRGRCKIILPIDIDPEARTQVYRHELAHCNGWRH